MTRLPNQKISYHDKTCREHGILHDVECKVLNDGFFRLKINNEHVPVAKGISQDGISVEFDKNDVAWLCANSLDKVRRAYELILKELLSCKIIIEAVIRYKWKAEYSAYLNGDGILCQNAVDDKEYYNGVGGKWYGKLNGSTKKGLYTIGLAARIEYKITTTSTKTCNVKYMPVRLAEKGAPKIEKEGDRLNKFVGITLANDLYEDIDIQEVPYTEEAAKWFADQMETIQSIAFNIDQFFKKQDNVMMAIKSNTSKLLSSTY